jgi:hypothetical protein
MLVPTKTELQNNASIDVLFMLTVAHLVPSDCVLMFPCVHHIFRLLQRSQSNWASIFLQRSTQYI